MLVLQIQILNRKVIPSALYTLHVCIHSLGISKSRLQRILPNFSIVKGVPHSTTQADAKLLASKEGMCGLWPGTIIITLRTSSILVATRSCRHRLDALEVDEQVDCSDDCTQWGDDDQSQHSRRHYSGRCCWRTCRDVIGHVTVETNHRQRRRRHRPVSWQYDRTAV